MRLRTAILEYLNILIDAEMFEHGPDRPISLLQEFFRLSGDKRL